MADPGFGERQGSTDCSPLCSIFLIKCLINKIQNPTYVISNITDTTRYHRVLQ